VGRGVVEGTDVFNALGYVDIVNAQSAWDVWQGPTAIQPEPVTAGYQPSIVSSSANDAAAGTGIRRVNVLYLDTAGREREEAVTLNGVTAVNMVATNVMFIQCMHAIEVGSGLIAAGNIDARNGVTVTKRIATSGNRCTSTMRQVPAGRVAYINQFVVSSSSNAADNSQEIKLRLRTTNMGDVVYPGIYLFKKSVTPVQTGLVVPINPPLRVPPLATIKVSAWTLGTGAADASWSGWLENI
jgi:hypothetical protein